MPVVEDGKIVVAKVLRCFATFDHRVLDGAHAAHMSKVMKKVFADPAAHFGALPEPRALESGATIGTVGAA